MKQLIECVPNFSEGRDENIINAIAVNLQSVEDVKILDIDSGKDTNRTVITIIGSPMAVAESAFRGIKIASELIDMRNHNGTHPRIGATDVCPFIPVSNVSEQECVQISQAVGERVGKELGIPVYLYEKSAKYNDRIKLPDIRKGEYEGLSNKLLDPNWMPDFGPSNIHIKAGATVMGCRDFLIAYNINLNTKDTRLATDIAFELREAGRSKRIPSPESKNLLDGEIVRHKDGRPIKVPGIFKDIKAIGWYVEKFKRAQISVNFNNYRVSTIHDVYDKACLLAEERGVRVTGSELVGLIPLDAIIMAGKHYLKKQNRSIGVSESDIINCAIQSLGLDDVTPFLEDEKIIDYQVKNDEYMFDYKFLTNLSSNTPAPGGGSVSALSGALGAALASMVAALTHEKKGMLSRKPLMDEIGVEMQIILKQLAELVNEDTLAFNKVIDANRLPNSNPEETKIKSEQILKANKYAIEIPLKTAKKCFRILEVLNILTLKCNPNSISDAGVAAEVAFAGLRGGCMNALINLSEINDGKFIKNIQKEIDGLLSEGKTIHNKVYKQITSIIKEANNSK